MHEDSTRAWNNRRQKCAITRGFLAAVLVWTLAAPATGAYSILDPEDAPPAAGLAALRPAYDASVFRVAPGQEGIQLSARLADDANPLGRDIRWKIADDSGMVVAEAVSPQASLALSPARYEVEAAFGSGIYRQSVVLEEGQRLALDFLLNAGALRIQPLVTGLSTPIPAVSFIYAASGADKGKLVTISRLPGEVLFLPAGAYRVESRAEPGNARLVSDVAIRAGLMSSMQLAHEAGLLRLSYGGGQGADVRWQVLEPDGTVLLQLAGAAPSVLMKPGDYRIEMQAEGRAGAVNFTLAPGEERHLSIGR